MTSDDTTSFVSTIASVALTTLVVGSALAVGTVHTDVLLIVSAVAILSTTTVLFLGRSRVRRLPAPALVLVGLSLWSAVQAIPLPIGFLTKLTPYGADVWLRSLHPFDESPLLSASISLDPGASLVEALKWFTYATVFILAHFAGSWSSRPIGPIVAFGSAACVSLVALGHGLVGATSLFGLYTPELAIPRWGVPPILNPNNLSGYLNLGAFCGLGLLLSQRSRDESRSPARLGLICAGLAVVVAVSVLAASRAGVLGLGLGVMLFAALVWVAGSDRRERAKLRGDGTRLFNTLGPAIVALGGGLLLAVTGASEATWTELWDSNVEKLRVAAWSAPLIRHFPLFGVGRGAFESAFPAYRPASGNVVYAYPENFVVQWIAEWGIPVALLAVVAIIALYRSRPPSDMPDKVRIGAWVGMGVLLLQNLVDLALEVPAIVILACAVLGSLYATGSIPPGSRPSDPRSSGTSGTVRRVRRWLLGRGRRRLPAFAFFGLGSVAFVLAMPSRGRSVSDERSELHAVYERTSSWDQGAFEGFKQKLRAAMVRHPAEPYFPLIGAIAAYRTKGINPMPWIAAALERDPSSGRAHLVLADILGSKRAVSQALMELRLAVEGEPNLNWAAGQSAVHLTHDVELLERAAPDGAGGAPVLLGIASAAGGNDNHCLRMTLLNHAIARDETSLGARVARATEMVSAITSHFAPCGPTDPDPVAAVRDDIEAMSRLAPMSCHPVILEAKMLELQEKVEEGEILLASRCSGCVESEACSAERVRLAAKRKPGESIVPAVRAYLSIACSHQSPCVAPHVYVGDLFAARGDWNGASDQYRQAALASDDVETWLKASNASARAGDPLRASQALSKAQQRGRGDPALEQRIQQQRRDMVRQQLGQSDNTR
jgi:hypothetical protein